jgi:hypothetical protein
MYMQPMCIHVWIMNKLEFNLEWTKILLKMSLNLIKN